MNNYLDKIDLIKEKIKEADAIVIGAGAGLSTSAGFTYSGSRFEKYFSDFEQKYGFSDMYSGGFYPYETLEEHWGYWSRYIFVNRYMDAPKNLYSKIYDLVKEKEYFVLTTNVDHCFQKAGFSKERLFYTQGDYGLFQCSSPCHTETYDNKEAIEKMVRSQGFEIENGELIVTDSIKSSIPAELIPVCPKCGKPMSMNLRADATFVEDEGWHEASKRYTNFLNEHVNQKVLFLELGVGYNTPGIIKYPFWQMTKAFPQANYICLNKGEAYVPAEIVKKSICINEDIDRVIEDIMKEEKYE
ncbi:MAG: Sir2 silent information regulator family NAD-dependent deacetylase [Bacillota bacterium]|nr:Sir2 silent information regulator family NAD-dependent deacetylase [Bacillota bacterium]